jgi:aerobic carbon-monoxide dehydrogenase medium subunit
MYTSRPAEFTYHRPESVDEAVGLLAELEDSRPLAGGHSLLPAMKLRFSTPAALVDIGRIRGLDVIEREGDGLRIGALATHAAVAASELVRSECPMLAEAAALIGDRQVRNRGTIGGSLAHADPAADWLVCLTALGADLILAGPGGPRRVALDGFVVGAMQTMLAANELIAGVRIAKFSRRARFGYHKICRKVGEFAEAIGAVAHDPDRGVCRLAVSTPSGAPLQLAASAELFEGVPDAGELERRLATAGLAGDAYERRLRAVALARALATATP